MQVLLKKLRMIRPILILHTSLSDFSLSEFEMRHLSRDCECPAPRISVLESLARTIVLLLSTVG